jgi:predicted GNAT family acetyltransferase
MAVEVREAPRQRRFEVYEDDELAGFADYLVDGDVVSIPHTQVEPARGGRGLATELIRVTLDTLRDRKAQVLPYCPFVSAYIAKHPEYVPLVPQSARARFGLPADPV